MHEPMIPPATGRPGRGRLDRLDLDGLANCVRVGVPRIGRSFEHATRGRPFLQSS